ncbi:MAG: TetR-like C-terminal domain-containing protein [Trueperaceae bacterium]
MPSKNDERTAGASGRTPRAGLTRDRVVAAASELVDRDGLAALSLAALAKRFDVKTPSLYNHVDGLDGLRRELRRSGLRRLANELQKAAMGRAGHDALLAVAHAYRAFANVHPGLYALAQDASVTDDDLEQAASAVVDVVVAVLAGYGIDGDDAVHATRAVRSALHGFVALETQHGFGLPQSLDETFTRLVAMLHDGLAAAGGSN